MRKISFDEISTLDLGAFEIGIAKITTLQISASQVTSRQGGFMEVGAPQVGSSENRIGQVKISKASILEIVAWQLQLSSPQAIDNEHQLSLRDLRNKIPGKLLDLDAEEESLLHHMGPTHRGRDIEDPCSEIIQKRLKVFSISIYKVGSLLIQSRIHGTS